MPEKPIKIVPPPLGEDGFMPQFIGWAMIEAIRREMEKLYRLFGLEPPSDRPKKER